MINNEVPGGLPANISVMVLIEDALRFSDRAENMVK
jgi:hypothetical protein